MTTPSKPTPGRRSRDPAIQKLLTAAVDDLQLDLVHFAWNYVGNEEDAWEVTQESLMALVKAVDRGYTLSVEISQSEQRQYWLKSAAYVCPIELECWLFDIIRKQGNECWRKYYARKHLQDELKHMVSESIDETSARTARERLEWLDCLIQELFPPDRRVILIARWIEHLSYAAIVKRCGFDEATLRRWVCRARTQLLVEVTRRDPEYGAMLAKKLPNDEELESEE